MIISKNQPIEYPVNISPGQPVLVEFKTLGIGVGGKKVNSKIAVDLYVYYLIHPQGRSTNMVNSGPVSIWTGEGEDKVHKVKLIAPDFNFDSKVKSIVYITTDNYSGIIIGDDLVISGESGFEEKKAVVNRMGVVGGVGGNVPGLVVDIGSIPIRDDLKDDLQNRIFYMRPWAQDSFGIVGWHHIHHLIENQKLLGGGRIENNSFEVVDVSWESIKDNNWWGWTEKRNFLIHPFLYPFAGTFNLSQNMTTFNRLFSMKRRIGGFDVADSDRISGIAVSVINKLDLIIVPSIWAKNSYINSGVRSEIVQVLGHGIRDEFINVGLGESLDTNNESIKMLRNEREKGSILVLFFMAHSPWRKGADLVRDVMIRVQRRHGNVILVIKGWGSASAFSGIRFHEIRGWLDNNDLRRLYDCCDIVVSPSRGGGFELNAFEGVSRGLPTLVSNGGCFTDLMDYYIPINVSKYVAPLAGNPVHVGVGPEVDVNDFENKLEDVIINLDQHKKIFRDRSGQIRNLFSWKNIALRLENILREYDFIR